MRSHRQIAFCLLLLVGLALTLAVIAAKHGHRGDAADRNANTPAMMAVYAGTTAALVSSRKKRSSCVRRKDSGQQRSE